MTFLRSYVTALMALVMVLTSHSMAEARGMMASASGEMVICTGSGPVTVTMDADGQPMSAPHICPDCTMGLFDAGAAPFEPQVLALVGGERLVFAEAASLQELHRRRATARGPPLFI